MSITLRVAGSLSVFLLACAGVASAAPTPKEIETAIKKGADALRAKYAKGVEFNSGGGVAGAEQGIGAAALAGIAMLEAGVSVDDPAVKKVTAAVREASYTQTMTYHISLCLMYLDRYGDPNDVPLIQILATRLLVGQTSTGGWGYECIEAVLEADARRLRAIKPGQPGRLIPEVAEYAGALARLRGANAVGGSAGDNSNTQFAVIAVWMARKHGVPVDDALRAIDQRFRTTQGQRTGGWPYMGAPPGVGGPVAEGTGSPSMYCAGLIGLSVGVARRQEAAAPKVAPKPEPKPEPAPKKGPDDPFFNPTPPAPKGGGTAPPLNPKQPAGRPPDALDGQIRFALQGLGMHLAEMAKAGKGALAVQFTGAHGHYDLYFLWSLERVGVIYGIEKIGDVDWYEAGSTTLIARQEKDGTWAGNYNVEVNTSFAVLFLCRSNLARDLSGKVQNETATEMRVVPLPGATDTRPAINTKPTPTTGGPKGPNVPDVTGSEAGILAGELLRAAGGEWDTVLKKLQDTRGPVHTQALVLAMYRLDGDRLKSARDALALRLTRMSADTLRTMAKNEDLELRRAAVLAMAMREEPAHIPDLIAALSDDEELVIRAAKAGLKSLTGQDFGPPAFATAGDKKLATTAWNEWLAKQKK